LWWLRVVVASQVKRTAAELEKELLSVRLRAEHLDAEQLKVCVVLLPAEVSCLCRRGVVSVPTWCDVCSDVV
jgi:hypothetical protein